MEILSVGERQDNKVYVIRVNDVRLLVGCPLDLEQILSYLPEGVEIYSDEERAGKKGSKPEGGSGGQKYLTVDNQKYLQGEVKLDLSLFTSVDIASIDYIWSPS